MLYVHQKMDQLFLLAKYKIVKLWSKNEKKGKFRPKMKKMRCHEKMKKKKNKNGSGQAAFIKN